MPPKVKKALWWILAIFLLYAIFRSPNQAADILKTIWDILVTAFTSIGRFFDALLGHR